MNNITKYLLYAYIGIVMPLLVAYFTWVYTTTKHGLNDPISLMFCVVWIFVLTFEIILCRLLWYIVKKED